MRKVFVLLFVFILGSSYKVQAETPNEIYNKLLIDCNDLKSKKVIVVDCKKLNVRELKRAVENGLYEIKVKNIELEYTPIINNLNKATIYGDYATICENLKEKSKTAEFGEKCKFPKDCYDTDIETIKKTAIECLNIVVPITRDCKVWFEDATYMNGNKIYDKRGKLKEIKEYPVYAMKLNKTGLNELFFKRLLEDNVIKNPSELAYMERCGYRNSDVDRDGNFYKFASRPVVSVSGYSVASVLDNLSGKKYATALERNGFKGGGDFLDWIQGCFFEVLGDKVSNLKLNKKTGCWY